MSRSKKVCVFCSSRNEISPVMVAEAKRLGQMIAEGGGQLIYGGAETGAMGAVANACLERGGHVTGVFPKKDLHHEIAHPSLEDLVFVEGMWERKQKIAQLSDAFIVFPGGTGTLDELFEIMVLKQLEPYNPQGSIVMGKPLIILNLFGFWDPMLEMLQIYQGQGFIDQSVAEHYHVVETVEEAVSLAL